MHAGVKKKDIGRLSKELRDGEWKVVENFTLSPASGQYRPTNSAWKMTLTMNTVVSNCSIKSPEMFLSLVPIQTIIDGGLNQNLLIDVMGQVLDVSEIKSVPVAGKEKRKLEFVLRGSSDDQRINCCLWSEYADQLYDACKKADGQTVICLIRFAKINFYQGELQVTNGYSASKLIVNPRCSEAESFKNSLPDDGAMIVIKDDDQEQAEQSMKEKEEAWLSLETKSVYDIQTATEIDKFKICCKVTGVDTDWGWYYFGCGRCQYRVTKDLKKEASTKPRPKVPIWFCEKCKTNVKNVGAKFKLHLLVEDESAKTKVMLLDTVAAGIVTKSASFLLNGSYDEIQDPLLLPDAIKSLIGNSYEFLVGVEKEHIHYGKDTYKVHNVRKGRLILKTESGDEHFTTIDNGSNIGSCEELSVVKSSSHSISDDGSTPSPKRSYGEIQNVPALCSTSKKHCPKLPQLQENEDLVNPDGIAQPFSVSNPSEALLIQNLND